MTPERSYGLVVFGRRRNKWYVAIVDGGGWWTFPKGHRESGEGALNAAIRECREETGLDLHPSDVLHAKHFIDAYTPESTGREKIVTYWAATLEDTPELSPENRNEIKGAEWKTVKQAEKQLTYEGTVGVLKEALHTIQD